MLKVIYKVSPSFFQSVVYSIEQVDGVFVCRFHRNKGAEVGMYDPLPELVVSVDAHQIEYLRTMLDDLRLPDTGGVSRGVDGTTFELEYVTVHRNWKLEWWSSVPETWVGVSNFIHEFTRFIDALRIAQQSRTNAP